MSKLLRDVLALLDAHYEAFMAISDIARKTKHPVPVDTRGWSQILVSSLSAIDGLERKKGADLADGSDVKGANTWEAIDTPRFNGVIKAGTLSKVSGKMDYLDATPNIFFVLWDIPKNRDTRRCRVWCVRPPDDKLFRAVCQEWYKKRLAGEIRSNNFQLHPPRGSDSNVITNTCGNLSYPLLFSAERTVSAKYQIVHYDRKVVSSGVCQQA